jgi:hypothetical protein
VSSAKPHFTCSASASQCCAMRSNPAFMTWSVARAARFCASNARRLYSSAVVHISRRNLFLFRRKRAMRASHSWHHQCPSDRQVAPMSSPEERRGLDKPRSMQQRHRIREARDERPDASQHQRSPLPPGRARRDSCRVRPVKFAGGRSSGLPAVICC